MLQGSKFFISATLALLGWVGSASANSAYTYQYKQNEIYEIVIADDKGDSTLAPGVYRVDKKTGVSFPVLPGTVLGVNRSYKGILAYLSRDSVTDSAHDVATVLNGYLTLMNQNSSPTDPGSFLTLGGKSRSAINVQDLISGTSVEVPQVGSMDDVRVVLGPLLAQSPKMPKGGRALFVSLRSPSPIGSGLTIAMIAEHGSGPNHRMKLVGNTAWVIGHEFVAEEVLARMVPSANSSSEHSRLEIYSSSIIAKFKNQLSRLGEIPAAAGWIDQIGRFQKYLIDGLLSVSEINYGIPIFDLLSMQESLFNAPLESVYKDKFRSVGQTFDPTTGNFKIVSLGRASVSPLKVGRRELLFMNARELEASVIGRTKIDRDPKSGEYFFYAEGDSKAKETDGPDSSHEEAYIYFSNGVFTVLTKNESAKEFQSLPIRIRGVSPGDQIQFLKKRVNLKDRFVQVFYVLRKAPRTEKCDVFALIIQESESLNLVQSSVLYANGPAMGFKEFAYRVVDRVVDRVEDPLFDAVTPVRGPAAYLKLDKGQAENSADSYVMGSDRVPKKTAPYTRVLQGLGGRSQVYLRTLTNELMVRDWLFFRSFDSSGAKEQRTGFYMINHSSPEKPDEFIPGFPLLSRTEKASSDKTHVMQSKILSSPGSLRALNVNLSIFPFVEKLPTKKKKDQVVDPAASSPEVKDPIELTKFKLGLSFTPDVSGTTLIDGVLRSVEIPFPYASLAYSQVLQGYKGKSNEFYILLFFRKDEKVKGSSDSVVTVHGSTRWTSDPKERLEVFVDEVSKLHRGFVAPGTAKAHLLMDPDGAYYWVDDPAARKDTAAFKVRKLSSPEEALNPRSGQLANLRELDHLKETEVGLVSSSSRFSGRWEIFSVHRLRDLVPGLSDYLDKRSKYLSVKEKVKEEKKEKDRDKSKGDKSEEEIAFRDDRAEGPLFEAFEKYLDSLVAKPRELPLRPRVILVDPTLRDRFKLLLFTRLAEGNSAFSLSGPNRMDFYHADATLDDVEIAEELQYISAQRERPSLLYMEPDLLKISEISTRSARPEDRSVTDDDKAAADYYGYYQDEEDRKRPPPFASIEANAKADLLVLLASQGRAKSVRGLKKLTQSPNELPILTIATPDEWREVQEAHPHEVAAGALDDFEMNYDFLTSPWTLWPPKSDKAPSEVKDMAKIPYRAEEMRVFPTLDKVLVEAASGQLKGKQKIIIVPQELKNLVQKLVMLRWSSGDGEAGVWNHQNRKLALHKILGSNNTQDDIHDSFRAIRGASHSRNSVLYTDLETVLRIGRPGASRSEHAFRIRDPIRGSRGYLMESEGKSQSVPPEDDEDAATAEDIGHELVNVNMQLTTAKDEVDNLARLKRMAKNDAVVAAGLQEQIAAAEREVKNLKALRATLQSKLRNVDPDFIYETDENGDSLADQLAENDDEDEPNPPPSEDSQPDSSAVKTVTDKSAYPHMLWWIAAEGQAVQPRRRAGWKLKTAVNREVATVLVGTEEELQRLQMEMSFESKFFDINEHFEISRLEAPSEQTKFQMVQQLFGRPEVVGMGIEFKLRNDNGLEPRQQLTYHFINRIDQLAYDQKIEKTAAFVRAYIALKNALVEDVDLRRSRQINEKFIERLFTKVFPMPLNPEILESQDPLNRLRRQDQAVRDLQTAGYEGSQDLKRRFFENILSQTRPTDTSRPIPNSQILYGSTSTGKTFLLRMLFKMLDLTEYNRARASNEDADVIFINVAKVTDAATNDPDKIPIDDVIKDILDLLAQPKGTRAHIVFDDFHKASTKVVREKLAQFIQGLFEAHNGMYTVRSRDGRRHREIPVQNLNLYMTLNPTANESIRKQYVKDSHKGSELLKREVLAALSGDGFNPEESFLARWSDILNLDNFPRSAKVPELVKRVRQNASRSGQMVLVDPLVIDHLIDRFPEAHARELLSPATAALTSLPSSAQRAPFYLVSLRKQSESEGKGAKDVVAHSVSQKDLATAVREFTQIDPVKPKDPRSLAQVMSFVMRNFRLQAFNFLTLESHMSDTLRLSLAGQANVLKTNFLLGMSTHIIDNLRIPDGELDVRPEDFQFLNRSEVDELIRHISKLKDQSRHFPLDLDSQNRPGELNLDAFLEGSAMAAPAVSQRQTLIETVGKVEAILLKSMQTYLRLGSTSDLKEIGMWNDSKIHDWFQRLPDKDPEEAFRANSQELLHLFFDFQERLHSPSLPKAGKVSFNLYDQVRLFAYIMDKAILRLPWGQIANFTIKVATASSDFSLGTRASFREYVGVHQLSAFTIATPEFINEMYMTALSGPGRHLEGRVPDLKEQFDRACEELLMAEIEGER